jgi:hypothetical protein
MRRAATVFLLACGCVGGNGDAEPPPAASLVREGTKPAVVRSGDLDGDGVAEVVVASVGEESGPSGFGAPYLEVFAAEDDRWMRVFDGATQAPPGSGTPETMLQPQTGEFAVGQAVDVLELADLDGDGSLELVAAVATFGASAGPVELWIVEMTQARDFRTEFYMSTERGGQVAVDEDRVSIEFGVYRKNDPGCCPSSFEVRTIGHDPDQDAIVVLERERRPAEKA